MDDEPLDVGTSVMICDGDYKGSMGKVERRNEVANGDDWYLVRLDNEHTGLYRRTQLDDAQDMMDCIASMDTSTETSEQSKAAASEQSEAASESPRTSAAAAAMVTINPEANMQTEEGAAGTSELSTTPLDYGSFVIIADDDTPTDMGDVDQTVGEVVEYNEDNQQYLVQYCSEEAAAENMSVWCPRERLTEYEEPASKRQRLADSA